MASETYEEQKEPPMGCPGARPTRSAKSALWIAVRPTFRLFVAASAFFGGLLFGTLFRRARCRNPELELQNTVSKETRKFEHSEMDGLESLGRAV
jgi:hypothetical protein